MNKEQKVDNILTVEDFEVIKILLCHYKSFLLVNKNSNGLPFDFLDDFFMIDIINKDIDKFLKGE